MYKRCYGKSCRSRLQWQHGHRAWWWVSRSRHANRRGWTSPSLHGRRWSSLREQQGNVSLSCTVFSCNSTILLLILNILHLFLIGNWPMKSYLIKLSVFLLLILSILYNFMSNSRLEPFFCSSKALIITHLYYYLLSNTKLWI